jgi:hypothetical protein
MAGKLDAIWVPSPTRRALTRGIDNTQSATRYVTHLFSGRPADGIAIIGVQQGAGSKRQARHLTGTRLRAEAQALNPHAKSPSKIGATMTSPRGTS